MISLDPGSRTIGLTGLMPNCAVDGPGSRTVTIAEAEVAPIEFAVVCTATSGVIRMVVTGPPTGTTYRATVDGATPFPVGIGGPSYVRGVPGGDHVVSLLAPANCPVEPNQQSVRVTTGGQIRDTVEAHFSVTACTGSGTIRVRIRSSVYGPMGFTPVQLILDGEIHDVRVPDFEELTYTIRNLTLGVHSLQARMTFDLQEWTPCHTGESLHDFTKEVGTGTVDLHLVASTHCHFF
jgi:hypothetical protein